ncbi:MAG: AlwI family type II restriction endonuclease [Muribaculaceae bacterium]|nr:AlwI family type II restriction endonuclease [Muribaculaceae bacterium]
MLSVKSRPINGKTLFFSTSPRTLFKIIPEIELLVNNLKGEIWNPESQAHYYTLLAQNDFFEGSVSSNAALSARDRINRLPKCLGYITLPVIGLSEVGEHLLNSENKEEIVLKQLLKFQLPSPYHPLGKKAGDYWVKPYLEILRLIYDLDGLSFDELQIFGMQLINYTFYNSIVEKIHNFRKNKKINKGSYKEFKQKIFLQEAKEIYLEEVAAGDFKTRESQTATEISFLKKKLRNLRDYADALVRHLRATGIVNVTAIGKSLSISNERKRDVEFILNNIKREPEFINNLRAYQEYLFNPEIPRLLTDDIEKIKEKLTSEFDYIPTAGLTLMQMKDKLNYMIEERKKNRIRKQVVRLKSYEQYNEIEETFKTLKDTYNPPLFFEWNIWRAMTMLNGGNIQANLKFDDQGNPMNTALGNIADIVCDYGDFDVTVEVTLARGQTQFKMEGEPVPRHIGMHKERNNNKLTYCFFIAPIINPATIAHFYSLYHINIKLYGGKCVIIPLTLDTFIKMLRSAVFCPEKPTPKKIRKLFEG